jgi:kynurenine formamidase
MSSELFKVIQFLKEKRWVDLTHTFGPDSPHFSAFDSADFQTLFTHDGWIFCTEF